MSTLVNGKITKCTGTESYAGRMVNATKATTIWIRKTVTVLSTGKLVPLLRRLTSLTHEPLFFRSNGSSYTGAWKDGKMHGEGTFYKVDGTTKSGRWEKGKKVDPSKQAAF